MNYHNIDKDESSNEDNDIDTYYNNNDDGDDNGNDIQFNIEPTIDRIATTINNNTKNNNDTTSRDDIIIIEDSEDDLNNSDEDNKLFSNLSRLYTPKSNLTTMNKFTTDKTIKKQSRTKSTNYKSINNYTPRGNTIINEITNFPPFTKVNDTSNSITIEPNLKNTITTTPYDILDKFRKLSSRKIIDFHRLVTIKREYILNVFQNSNRSLYSITNRDINGSDNQIIKFTLKTAIGMIKKKENKLLQLETEILRLYDDIENNLQRLNR